MFVSSTKGGETVKGAIAVPHALQKAEFSRILNKQIAGSVRPTHAAVSTQGLQTENKTPVAPQHVFRDTIFKHTPPVSSLLIKHPIYEKDCWDILYSKLNGDKHKLKMQEGSGTVVTHKDKSVPNNGLQAGGKDSQGPGLVLLGSVSKSDPTVSELLIKHPAYGKDCWNILYSKINRDKAYTMIPDGSRIYLNPETLEIVWNENSGPVARAVQADQPGLRAKHIKSRESDPFSLGLAKAVKPYLGKPYKEINCFELVVQGLEGVGVRYYGRDGLGERLVKMATEKGLSSNHYLSGEGLIETSGSQIYSKSVSRIWNSKPEALKVYQEVEPLLHEGLILSFSTPTRGHTGIISQREHNWTYINSGYMDHRIDGRASKGVGEEFLSAEIRNWFRLAANRRESLQITVGRLDEDKLRAVLTGKQAFLTGMPESLSQRQQRPHSG